MKQLSGASINGTLAFLLEKKVDENKKRLPV